MTTENPMITLEEAKALVAHLEQGDVEAANEIIHNAAIHDSHELFSEVGKLTRQLHDSLVNFNPDDKISKLTSEAIPDAQSRLEYVIEETEKAANSTMDVVERSMPIAEQLNDRLTGLIPNWKKLMQRQMEVGEFKALCHELDILLKDAREDSAKLNSLMTEILMAQGYQDLTGQVLKRVIELVNEVEVGLVELLATFGERGNISEAKEDKAQPLAKTDDKIKAEGPIIDAKERGDVAQSQDDVDDLLSSLGF